MALATIVWLLSLAAAFLCGWIFCASFSATAINDLSEQIAEMKRDADWRAATAHDDVRNIAAPLLAQEIAALPDDDERAA